MSAAAEGGEGPRPSRYESQKRRDWNTFGQYLMNHRPPLELSRCSGAHVLEFMRYLDQFGKTKVHSGSCPFFGQPCPPGPCRCPLRQAWGSLDALVGRLRAAFEENGGRPRSTLRRSRRPSLPPRNPGFASPGPRDRVRQEEAEAPTAPPLPSAAAAENHGNLMVADGGDGEAYAGPMIPLHLWSEEVTTVHEFTTCLAS
ncbi:hypothetical protein HPP92_016675 [Vanilla planifolia]|uniref:ALOG domain-containing protein n=1 Tax=Vanilla planifolia TaxID=51239 RepID=A0A835URH7_VANPL|nr:hypothetical protein HPP92_016675 [Vanilla planifolia]